MAGVYPLSRMQQLDPLSLRPLSAGRLFIFQAGTSTPFSAFKDYGLTNPHASPILLDSAGRVPMIYLADGTYRHRLESSSGTAQFDDDGIPTTGPSGGGGGGTVFDANALFQTGFPVWVPTSGLFTGFVRMNAKTIGNAGSGATERANSDTQLLFLWLYANIPDTFCPVSGGRSGNAAADYAAGKTIQLPDMRGRGPVGLSDMGGADSLRLSGVSFPAGSATVQMTVGGEAVHLLSAAEVPVMTPAYTSPTASFNGTPVTPTWTASNNYAPGTLSSTSPFTPPSLISGLGTGGGGSANANGSAAVQINVPSYTPTGTVSQITPAGSVAIAGGSVGPVGGGGVHNNMHPFALGTWFQKL